MANVYLVRDAAEAYAAANGGDYAAALGDPLSDGRTLIDFLPGGKLLHNPYIGVRDSPMGFSAGHQGQIGYEPFISDPPYGYYITAIGAEIGIHLVILSNNPNDP